METILLGLGRWSHISDVLRGECIRALSKKYRVVVLTEHIDAGVAKRDNYFLDKNITYVKLSVSHPRLWRIANGYLRHAFVRRYDKWLATREWFYRPTHSFGLRLLTALGSFMPKRLFGTSLFTWLEYHLARPTDDFKKLLEEHHPRLLALGSPGYSYSPFEAELVIFSKHFRLPTAAIDINFDNCISQAKFLRKTDYLMVWNNLMKDEAVRYHGYKPDEVLVAGCLRFDHYFSDMYRKKVRSREEFLRSKNLDPSKKTVFYATSTPVTYPMRKRFMQELLGLRQKNRLSGDPNILVRLHPHDTWDAYAEFASFPGVHIERAGSPREADTATKGQKVEMTEADLLNLTESILHTDVMLHVASTMIMEASILDRPHISIGFPADIFALHEYEGIKELIKTGSVPIAGNPEQLAELINFAFRHPESGREGRRRVVREYVQFSDGLSWKRTADFVGGIIKKA